LCALAKGTLTEWRKNGDDVLVVDDEPGVRDLLSDALRIAGYETETAATALRPLRYCIDTMPTCAWWT